MDKVRYAVIGTGYISQDAFMPSVDQTGNSVMTAIVSGSPEKAARLADFYGIEHVFDYQDYDAALASGLFDAVYVGLPNSMHADYSIRAAKAGVHALVEKPLAISVDEAEAMAAAAEKAGTYLMTAYRLHCTPGTVEALSLIREGAIGEVRHFHAEFSLQAAADNHRLKAEHWGGPLQDVGVYCLNAARHVFAAEPIEVAAMAGNSGDPRFGEVDEALSVVMRFPGGRLGTFTVSFNAGLVTRWQAAGTSGDIAMDPAFDFRVAARLVMTQGEKVTTKSFPLIDHFGAQTAYFSDCILNRQPPRPDGREGLADMRALCAIEEAMRTGLPQKIGVGGKVHNPDASMVRLVEATTRRLLV